MAKLRVFVSSTFYDLKYIRNDLERFIKDMGYESVLNERGNISYGKDKRLEDYCYKEIEFSDILVSVLGGRYGTQSEQSHNSITHTELKRAIELGKQVYIFIDRNVSSEYNIWKKNKDNGNFNLFYADNDKIYKFIDEIYNFPFNNTISTFETSEDITKYLKEQWSGLFQRFLIEDTKKEEINLAKELKEQIRNLNKLVDFLSQVNKDSTDAINKIFYINNKLVIALKKELKINYSFYFEDLSELNSWLSARSFKIVGEKQWDDAEFREWYNIKDSKLLKIKASLFDENEELVKDINKIWKDEYLILGEHKESFDTDDDFPF